MNLEPSLLIERIQKDHLTYLSEQRLESIAIASGTSEKSGIPGIFIEAGCALGGSAILVASLKSTERPMVVYDVFGMIPPPSVHDPSEVHERYKIIADGNSRGIGGDPYYGYLGNLLEVVQANFIKYGIDPAKRSVSFIKGLIQETMKIDTPVAFAHIDVDWYEPVLTCLERIFPNLSVGGSIIIDDYHDWGGCRMATDEFLSTVEGQYMTDDRAGSLMVTRITKNQTGGLTEEKSLNPVQYNEICIEDFISRYAGREVAYCANPGNAGDAIIACATFRLFNKLNIKPSIVSHTDTLNGKIMFYSGGGNLVEGKYRHAYDFIENNYRNNKEIILLPHTVHGYDQLLLSAPNLTIICREKYSYDDLFHTGFAAERLFLAPDMAFLLKTSDFSTHQQPGTGAAHIMRTDGESSRTGDLPPGNLDISMSWNGALWHRAEFAENVTYSLACYLGAFETIYTDRLHIAILAALMNKEVILYSNNYYKNKAVYEYSLRGKFNNVSFADLSYFPAPPVLKQKHEALQEQVKQLESELQEKTREITVLNEAAETIRKMLSSRSWRITAPLRALAELFRSEKQTDDPRN